MKNRSKIVIKGLNQEKILNNLSKQVKIYNFRKNENFLCEFEVDYKNRKKVDKFLTESNVEVLSVDGKGVLNGLKKIFSSIGILFGLALCVLIYTLQYFFVWNINIYGLMETEEVKTYISNNLPSRLKSKINIKEIELGVRQKFKEVSSISVAIIGQSLIVNINQSQLPEELEGDFEVLKSSFDGQITEINLVQGTLNCKVGDIVKKGDILVFPYMVDSQGERRDVKPKAEIMADVWLSETTQHYDYFMTKKRTGKKITNSQIMLGNMVVYENNCKLEFAEYEVEESEEILTKNLFLPLRIKKKTYFETTTFEISQPFSEVKDEIVENTRQKALQFLQKNEIIKKENFVIKQGYNLSEVTYTITVTRNIGG